MSNLKEIKAALNNLTPDYIEIDIVNPISEQLHYKPNIVRKGINQGCLLINGKVIKSSFIRIRIDDEVKFQEEIVLIEFPKTKTTFDIFINKILIKYIGSSDISKLSPDNKNKLSAFVIEYFSEYGYNVIELSNSVYNDQILTVLDEFYKRNFSFLGENKIPRKKDLVEHLILLRSSEYTAFEKLVSLVTSDMVDLNSNVIFQDFSKLFARKSFVYLVKPLLPYAVDPIRLIERFIRNYKVVTNAHEINEKIALRSKSLKDYATIQVEILSEDDHIVTTGFRDLISYFQEKCNQAIGFSDTGEAELFITSENRTYNFDVQSLFVYAFIENRGTGVAKNISIIPLQNLSYNISEQDLVDILPPQGKRKVKFKVDMTSDSHSMDPMVYLEVKLKWSNDFDKMSESNLVTFELQRQNKDLPWEELRRSNPYGIVTVDDPNKLFGRDKLIEDIKWNIEKNRNITSYILYGQKRVGKSSIVKTLDTIYKEDENILFVYKVIADVKNTDPNRTFLKLGEALANIIKSEFRTKSKLPEVLLPDLNNLSFGGSLSPLIELIEQLSLLNKHLRVVIALDEFDELNKEFFEDGEIGKTFALNIGKGLNDKSNIGFILVGSENMVSKKIHGMRLNTFEIKKVDTFDKTTEFEAYCKIITEPSKSCLSFAPEMLDLLYDDTNGNPYFTNMLADKIFRSAYDKRISFIDFDYGKNVVDHVIVDSLSTKDFEHFWQDGLSEEDVNYEKILDRRKRVLTAFAQSKNENPNCDWYEVKRKIKYPKKFSISESAMEETLNEFIQRGIIKQNSAKSLSITPTLFQIWLLQTGVYQIIATLEDKDEILDKIQQEQKLYVSNDELSEIIELLSPSDRKTTVDELRKFLDQFKDNTSKRWITDFLKKTLVISNDVMLDHLKKSKREIWQSVEVLTGELNLRKDAEILCFSDSVEQNHQYVDFVKRIFQFSSSKTIKQLKDLPVLDREIDKLIIYEPLIDCEYFYRNELSVMLKNIHPERVRSVAIHILCFIITDEAKAALEELLSTYFSFDYKVHALKTVQRSEISPFYNNNDSVNNATLKILSEFDKNISDDACLVKIGSILPYQCFPILWCKDLDGFKPLYSNRVSLKTHRLRMNISKKLKNLSFESESDKIEFKASLTEPAYNWKEIKKVSNVLKNMPASQSEGIEVQRKRLNELFTIKLPAQKKVEVSSIIKHSIAKNLSAFANTKGGEIYVGIEDDFTVRGLVYDYTTYKSQEDIRRAFSNIVEKYLGIEHAGSFDLEFIKIYESNEILRISIPAIDSEVWVKVDEKGNALSENQRELYIREHHGSKKLFMKEYYEWKKNRSK